MNIAGTLPGAVIVIFAALAACPAGAHAADGAQRFVALRAEAAALENGEGVTKDPLRAFELYCQAARDGDAEAQYAIGWMYANGRGVMRNDSLASLFFGMAAAQGFVQAQAMLPHVGPPASDLPECMRHHPVAEYSETPVRIGEAIDTDIGRFVPANADQERWAALVQKIAPEYQVSPLLALAVIRAESNFDPQARSPKNAQGLMQLIPETSARFKVKKPYDPVQNLRGGLAYLRWLLAYFQGNVPLVAAAYNAGEGTVERYRGVPPYAETRDYVRRIMQIFRNPEHPFDPSVTEPSPELQRISAVKTR